MVRRVPSRQRSGLMSTRLQKSGSGGPTTLLQGSGARPVPRLSQRGTGWFSLAERRNRSGETGAASSPFGSTRFQDDRLGVVLLLRQRKHRGALGAPVVVVRRRGAADRRQEARIGHPHSGQDWTGMARPRCSVAIDRVPGGQAPIVAASVSRPAGSGAIRPIGSSAHEETCRSPPLGGRFALRKAELASGVPRLRTDRDSGAALSAFALFDLGAVGTPAPSHHGRPDRWEALHTGSGGCRQCR